MSSAADVPTDQVLQRASESLAAFAASAGDTVARDSVNGGQPTGAPEQVATENRVNPDSKVAEPSAQTGKPPPNTGPAEPKVSHVQSERQKTGEESKVAQQFYKFNPAEVCEVALAGLTNMNPSFKSTWITADLSGSFIVDELRLASLQTSITEIEKESGVRIAFSHQRTKILSNIIHAITTDETIAEVIREGWSAALESFIEIAHDNVDQKPKRRAASPVYSSDHEEQGIKDKKGSTLTQSNTAVPITTSNARSGLAEFIQKPLKKTSGDEDVKRGSLVCELPDGTKIYGSDDRKHDRAPQVLKYPTLMETEEEAWTPFIVDFRRVDRKARPENKVPLVNCVDPEIIDDICKYTGLDADKWDDYSNDEVSNAMFKHTGPKTGTQAKQTLKKWEFRFDDRSAHQNTFLSKLKRFIREKRTLLKDIAIAAKDWENPDELTKKMVLEAMTHCFTNNATYVRFGKTYEVNSNLPKIREIMRDNAHHTTSEIFDLIVEHFVKVDNNVKSGLNAYHVSPFEERKFKEKTFERGKRDRTDDTRNDRRTPEKRARYERGVCGSRDHECSAETCLLWGEPEAKPAGYVWSVGEPSVWLTPDRHKDVIAKKPNIKWKKSDTSTQVRGGGSARGGGGFNRGGGGNSRGGGYGNRGRGGTFRGGSTFRGGGRGGRGGRGGYGHAGAVNAHNYSSYSLPPRKTIAETTGNAITDWKNFYASARVARATSKRAPKCVSTHMDNGAELNLIRPDIIMPGTRAALKVLDSQDEIVELRNNGSVIGTTSKKVLLEFALDTKPTVATITYREWFHVWDKLEDDMVLGGHVRKQTNQQWKMMNQIRKNHMNNLSTQTMTGMTSLKRMRNTLKKLQKIVCYTKMIPMAYSSANSSLPVAITSWKGTELSQQRRRKISQWTTLKRSQKLIQQRYQNDQGQMYH
jgi:hypothetical protein